MCKYFKKENFNCSHNKGSEQCGMYREFKRETLVLEDIEKEMNEISIQLCNPTVQGDQDLLQKRFNALQCLKTMHQKERGFKNLIRRNSKTKV